MTPHLKAYLECHKLSDPGYIRCEISGKAANDIMHISPRGMGGSKEKNGCRNLMAAQRRYHDIVERYTHLQWWFQRAHDEFLVENEPAIVRNPKDIFLLTMHDIHAGVLLKGDNNLYLTNLLRVVRMEPAKGKSAPLVQINVPADAEDVFGGSVDELLTLVSTKMYYNVPVTIPRGVKLSNLSLLDLLPAIKPYV